MFFLINITIVQTQNISSKSTYYTSTINFIISDLYECIPGRVLCQLQACGAADVDAAVRSASAALTVWSKLAGMERARVMLEAARLIENRREEIAEIEVVNNGKSTEARLDVDSARLCIKYFAGQSICHQWFNRNVVNRREYLLYAKKTKITTLLNKVVLFVFFAYKKCSRKHTTHFGWPEGEKIFRKIMEMASRGVKPVTLELGGKSPLIIFEDTDLENAVRGALMANFLFQGQVLFHAKLNSLLKEVVRRTKAIQIGDPLLDETRMGALVSKPHLDKVLGYVKQAKKEGARVLCGGEPFIPADPKLKDGYYMTPCVLDGCTDDMTCVREEIFGPVMSVLSFETEDEVLRKANDSALGLAAGVFTKDVKRAHRVIENLQAGSCFINNYNITPVEVPFGGYKASGGVRVIKDFLSTVVVEMGDVDSLF
uniref:Aldehyde dehydrogenase 9 family, member A1b n=1 Tax=Sinocyclocheilus anshuiensis TaxID=1608454 RepID=A0A671K5C7_9TELE